MACRSLDAYKTNKWLADVWRENEMLVLEVIPETIWRLQIRMRVSRIKWIIDLPALSERTG